MNIEEQYNLIEKCYYVCKGRDISCEMYHKPKDYCRCYVYKTLLNDKIKLEKGDKNLTFPVLEQILTNHNKMLNIELQTFNTIHSDHVSKIIGAYKKAQNLIKDKCNNSTGGEK